MPRTIKFLGGVALLVSGLTGPSIAVIPQLYQQAGWFTPTVAFVLVTFLAGSAALLLVESMASIDGNEDFQASIEYSTLADLFLGHRWHWAFQIILYIALQSQAITSLIESFQSMDALLVTIAHKSCAISFQKGWECVTTIPADGLGVFSDYIFISFGYLITLALVLPLGLIQLSDNIKFQIASFITLILITIVWIVTFFQVGITNNSIPAVASDQGTVVGYVISNFAFVTTIPAFVNNIHPSTNIRRVVWLSLIISCVIYMVIGLAGAGAFNTPPNSTILAVISHRRPSIIALISVYCFPIAVLITSIPVFMIVIRYNLLRGNVCSKPWATFWSSILPWIIVIPFQTNGWLTIIMNWTSLFFSSAANLVIPFLLYLMSKRYHALAVLDLHPEHDEFQLRPLQTTISGASTVSIHLQPSTPSQAQLFRTEEDRPTSPTDRSIDKLVLQDVDSESAGSASGNIIRLIRSPSIHRHYGETGEGSSTVQSPRKLSISKGTSPTAAMQGAVDQKDGFMRPMSPTSVALPPDDSFSISGNVVTSPTARRYSNAAAEDAASPARSQEHGSHRSVPEIRIDTATITHRASREYNDAVTGDAEQKSLSTPSRTSVHGLRFSIEKQRASTVSHLPSPREEMDDQPSIPVVGDEECGDDRWESPLDSTTREISTPDFSSSHSSSDDEAHRVTFEAFPKLNRIRWLNPTKVAIVSCGLTTTMVSAAIVYNIVLAAHGNNQG